MPRGQWITPDDAPSGVYCYRRVRVPVEPGWFAPVLGALDDLRFASNWRQLSGVSAEDTAAAFEAMLNALGGCQVTGEIVIYATTNAPDGTLPCDGATHLRTDYPALYGALDSAYHVDADHFRTPDLRGRSPIGSGQGTGLTNRAVGQAVGEEAHTLTATEMPSHVHSQSYPVFALLALAGTAASSAIASTTFATGSAGGDGAHNNMQPSHVVKFAIFT